MPVLTVGIGVVGIRTPVPGGISPLLAVAFGLVLAYGWTNVVGLYAAEGRFWEERRRAAQRFRQDSQRAPDAGFPSSSLTQEQQQLFAQLPAAHPA